MSNTNTESGVTGNNTDFPKRCNKCHRPMAGATAYNGACECGGLIEAGQGVEEKSLYAQCLELGVQTDHHESDLYIPKNETTKKLIAEYKFKEQVTTFISEIDRKTWYDIPFAYMPFWEKVQAGNAGGVV